MSLLVVPRLRRVRLVDLSPTELREILTRATTATPELRERVRDIIAAIRTGGDAALRDAGVRFGGGLPAVDDATPRLSIPAAELRDARDRLPRDLRRGLDEMGRNIERFHAIQVPPSEQWVEVRPGIDVGRVWRGLDRVAAYVPGGSAPLPSSLLMSAIPARLAGVRELVVATFAVVVASSTAGGAAGITGAGGAGRGVAGLGGAGATTRKATVRRRPWPG